MRKITIIFTVLLMVISCSKNLDNPIGINKDGIFKIDGAKVLPNLASIDTAALVRYLDNTPLTAHEKDSIAKVIESDALIKSTNSGNVITGDFPEYHDYSGKIYLKVFYAYYIVKLQHPQLTVTISDDYAMVWGGAWAYGYTGNGAFLTESIPLNYNTWEGQSKDHIVADPHYLEVYAIGMRIQSVDPAFLRARIHIGSSTSAPQHFPTATQGVPDNYLLVGGGAWDQYSGSGYGNMLTSSYPIGNLAWVGSGKDYRRSCLGQIKVYAIGIQNISYPNVGYLQLTYNETFEAADPGTESWCEAPVWDGYALTCPGGYCTYGSTGRMLVSLYPQDDFPVAELSSKDTPGYNDSGTNHAFGYGIEKRPY
jgi:hypothetical protein